MNPRQIDRFFAILSRELELEAKVYVTGAAAGALWGRVRPSVDIDFAVDSKDWVALQVALDRTVRLTGIQANYAEDIDRWGLITLMDYKRLAKAYRRFGRLRVYLLDPATWSIGKMTRYLDPDVKDMIEVFKRQRVPAHRVVRRWGEALKKSPKTAMLLQFRHQVEDFLKTHGRAVWGPLFKSDSAKALFYRHAGIGLSRRRLRTLLE